MHDHPTIFLVDDHPEGRHVLEAMLRRQAAVRSFASAEQLLDDDLDRTPGCVVADVRLPGMSGIQLHTELERRQVALPVILVTGYARVSLAVRALRAGAFHFLEKPVDADLLSAVVGEALRASADAAREKDLRDGLLRRLARLSERERQVLEHVLHGTANKVIADELGISIKTVEVHRQRMLRKVGVRTTPELLREIYGSPLSIADACNGHREVDGAGARNGSPTVNGSTAARRSLPRAAATTLDGCAGARSHSF